MKKFLLALLAASAFSLPTFAADDHAPKFGGVVVETKAGDLELVAKPEMIVIHVSDPGKPMKLSSGTGKVTVFNGKDKTEAPLALVGDKLEAKGSFKIEAGAKALAEVSLNGKPAVSARFTLK
jgi:glutamate 5-kinase